MASFPDKEWCLESHRRLVEGDPTASADLCKAILSPLVGWLGAKGRTRDKELMRDAATDALVDYIKRPASWNPNKGTLVSYLCMAADRDLLNLLEKVQVRQKHEVLSADVEDVEPDRNVPIEDGEARDTVRALLPSLERKVTSETDRELLALLLKGERSTDKFAVLLGIQNLPKKDKARAVKQHKDRLKKVVARLRNQRNAH